MVGEVKTEHEVREMRRMIALLGNPGPEALRALDWVLDDYPPQPPAPPPEFEWRGLRYYHRGNLIATVYLRDRTAPPEKIRWDVQSPDEKILAAHFETEAAAKQAVEEHAPVWVSR